MFSPTTQEIKKYIFLTTPDFGELNRRRSLNNFRPLLPGFFNAGRGGTLRTSASPLHTAQEQRRRSILLNSNARSCSYLPPALFARWFIAGEMTGWQN
jgi:hypothetical protein